MKHITSEDIHELLLKVKARVIDGETPSYAIETLDKTYEECTEERQKVLYTAISTSIEALCWMGKVREANQGIIEHIKHWEDATESQLRLIVPVEAALCIVEREIIYQAKA